LIVTIITNCD